MADRGTKGYRDVRSGLQLQGQAERVIAVALGIAAAVRVELTRYLLARIAVDIDAEVVDAGPPHDRPAARQPIIEHARPMNPERAQPPIAQCLHLGERLNLAVVQVAVGVVLLVP